MKYTKVELIEKYRHYHERVGTDKTLIVRTPLAYQYAFSPLKDDILYECIEKEENSQRIYVVIKENQTVLVELYLAKDYLGKKGKILHPNTLTLPDEEMLKNDSYECEMNSDDIDLN